MIDRRLSGPAPKFALPKGAIDTQTHIYVPGYPALPGGPGLPPDPLPDPDMYRRLMAWLGIERVVVTQGNAHQADNSCLLEALAAMGDVARGVAVITPETDAAEMTRLAEAGIVGARIMDLNGGAVGLDGLAAVDAKARDAGWVMAVQFDGSRLPKLEPQLSGIRSNWILDHHAKIFDGATPAHVDAIKRLIDTGRCWFKFAACYESSRLGGPEYADIAEVARQIAAHAPERIIWGTNWPHNLAKTTADYPDDGALVDTVLDWFPDDRARQLALVDTPQALFGFPPL